jgi:RNA polymerase primary sigma factor
MLRELYTDTPLSLDRSVGREDGCQLSDLLTAEESVSPIDRLARQEWANEVRRLLGTLSPVESRIVRWRFGLDDDPELTLKEIGDKYGLSRERIRQLQDQAICKMRSRVRDLSR